jgi:autotransporter-associated beta strand protein
MKKLSAPHFFALLFLLCTGLALTRADAGSATWELNPVTGDWNLAANWTPATIPDGSSDIATFGSSNVTAVFDSANSMVDSVVFAAGASAYTISPDFGTTLTISGSGVVNNSGVNQTFVTGADSDFYVSYIYFTNSSSGGGSMVTYLNKAAPSTANASGGSTGFLDTANAGSAMIVNEGGMISNSSATGGAVVFTDSASAANATFTNGGGTVPLAGGGGIVFVSNSTAANAVLTNNPGMAKSAHGGAVEFEDNATAGDAIITNNGASVPRAFGGETYFNFPARAGNSTLIADGGSHGGGGGIIRFGNGTFGDTARVEIFGNGHLDLSALYQSSPSFTIGSLEGNGSVEMGAVPLTIGTRNLSTVFSGTIVDSSTGGGGLTKTGRGTLTLSGANTYTGPTHIVQGMLRVSNRAGSATGSGALRVSRGRLTGNGIIAGDVFVGGIKSGGGVSDLAPGRNPATPQTLTIQSSLTLQFGATYACDLNSALAQADQVVANGVTIAGDAQIALADSSVAALPTGTTFTVLDNTSASPISGTFANLADGSTIVVGKNNYQVSYEGGDGNDLTLVVVP